MSRLALVVCALAALAQAPAAAAAPPVVAAAASPVAGIAPLGVTLSATGDAASYRWDLGDGSLADGPVVRHTYAQPGSYTAVVTGASAAGETAQASIRIDVRARQLSLAAPRAGEHAATIRLSGRLEAGRAGLPVRIYRGTIFVTSTRTRAGGVYATRIRLSSPGPYHARAGGARSGERLVRVRPVLTVSLPRVAPVGTRVSLHPDLRPRAAGTLTVRIVRDGEATAARPLRPGERLSTGRPTAYRVSVGLRPRPGYEPVSRTLAVRVVLPELGPGDRGPAVVELERRLRELRYALPRVDGLYGLDTVEAVYAFQRLHGRFPTGRVDGQLWRQLAQASPPRPRAGGGPHLEVDKSRQVLLDVRGGEVHRAVHVSTGATGNTPLGSWTVYRKVPGWDWVLWYPMYFLRGFAIHGYPEVPPYPASHGCVRVPMWLAPTLYAEHPFGTRIVVYA